MILEYNNLESFYDSNKLTQQQIMIDYKNNLKEFKDAITKYSSSNTDENLKEIRKKASKIIIHINDIRHKTENINISSFNKIEEIVLGGDSVKKNDEILNKRITFNKKYSNVKNLNEKKKKIITGLFIINGIIFLVLLYGSYLMKMDKTITLGKDKIISNKKNAVYNNKVSSVTNL